MSKYGYEKVIVSDIVALDQDVDTSLFEFGTTGYSKVSWQVEVTTGTVGSFNCDLETTNNPGGTWGSYYYVNPTTGSIGLPGQGLGFSIAEKATMGAPICAANCRITVKTSAAASTEGRIHVYLAP